jgi:nickel transport protein
MKPACYGIIAAAVLFPAALFGHGVEVYEAGGETAGMVHTVRFMYSTGEPMMYAKIFLYPPSSPRTEILQSIADRRGYFSFVPDENGEWRISAEDGMGHKGEITVAAGAAENQAAAVRGNSPGKSGTAAGRKPPLPLAMVLGLSLILNGFGLWYVAGKKRIAKKAPAEASRAH